MVGSWLHYYKIVKNEHWGYPEEWFPSVSATIGDRYPERSVFQIFIAITSGPRFVLVFLSFLLTYKPKAIAPKLLLVTGILRTLTCGGWTYVTSTDDHDWHDIFMISYIVFTLPWTAGRIYTTPANSKALFYRRLFAYSFFGTIIPLIYWFIQHKVHHTAGAYSVYAFFEWSLIILDVLFDAVTVIEFQHVEIQIVDVKGQAPYALAAQPPASTRKHYGFGWFQFGVQVTNGFIFWSVLTSLPLLVWFFPLWHMGISGYEALVATIIAPFLLYFGFLRGLFAYVVSLPYLGAAIGVAAYLAPDPVLRLELVGIGAAFAAISVAVQFWGISTRPMAAVHRASAFSLGLMLSSIAKLSFYTNNPIWPIMHEANGGWNKTGLGLALFGALFASRLQYNSNQPTSIAAKGESAVLSAFGLGGLLFALHTLTCDSSTIILWAWDGYPVTGPLPIPHGFLTLVAMALGIYIGVTKRSVTGNWTPWFIATCGAAAMYTFSGWTGYLGGLALVVYLLSIVPVFLESAGRHHPGKVFGLAFLILVLFYLAHVWIVAYAFVPGGFLLRERSDIVLAAQQIAIGFGVLANKKIKVSPVNKPVNLNTNTISLARKVKSQVAIALVVLLTLAAAITYKRFDREDPKPYHEESKVMTTGIWTIHFGLDNDMWASEGRMRDVINELELDVIGLLESDTQRAIMGHRDLTQQIAEELGYYADFGPGPNKHTWGAALLSKFPILKSTHHLLPSPVGELAPAIHATLDVFGKEVDIVVFHSGQEEDPEDRRLQSLYLADLMGSSDRPMVLLSYLVTKPLEGNYNTYVSETSGMKDIDPSDWDRWCEYILFKNIKRTGYARVSRSTITDTEIQVGKFVLDGQSTQDRIDESQVAEGLRFPELFRGDGIRGHRYHVFDEPRYYA